MSSVFRPAGLSSEEESDEEGFSFAEPATHTKLQTQLPNTVETPMNDIDLLRMEAIRGNLESLKTVIENKAISVDVISEGWTALMFAASYCHYDVMEYLLENGANPNFHQHGYTVLMAVCSCIKQVKAVCLKCAQILLKHGASVNTRQRNGVTPLMIACKEGNVRIVEELIKAKANVNAQDVLGWTPLIWTIHHNIEGQMDIIKVLLDSGADVNIKCGKGQNAYSHAINLGYHYIAVQIPKETDADDSILLKSDNAVPSKDLWTYLKENLQGANGENWMLWNDAGRCLDRLGIFHAYSDIFKENKINLVRLLTITEEELEDLSVLPVHRKYLLYMIRKLHLAQWKQKSIDLKNIKSLQDGYSMTDEIKLIANITRQISMIYASIIYLRINMKSGSEFDLNSVIDSTLNNAKILHSKIKRYHHCIKASIKTDKYPPDWIEYKDKKKSYRPLLLIAVIGVIGIMWKTNSYPKIVTFIKNFTS